MENKTANRTEYYRKWRLAHLENIKQSAKRYREKLKADPERYKHHIEMQRIYQATWRKKHRTVKTEEQKRSERCDRWVRRTMSFVDNLAELSDYDSNWYV